METKKNVPAKAQEGGNVVSISQTTKTEKGKAETTKPDLKAKEKTLEEMRKEFDRLSNLFHRKNRFENALLKLSSFSESIKKDGAELESDSFNLVLSARYNRDEIKISNIEVIAEAVNYLRSRIHKTIEEIEMQLVE